jgi:hypothetical protein
VDARLLRLSEEQDWRLIVTEMGLTHATDGQGHGAHRRRVRGTGARLHPKYREALQVKNENGVMLGRPRSTPDDVVARICGSARRARPRTPLPAT